MKNATTYNYRCYMLNTKRGNAKFQAPEFLFFQAMDLSRSIGNGCSSLHRVLFIFFLTIPLPLHAAHAAAAAHRPGVAR